MTQRLLLFFLLLASCVQSRTAGVPTEQRSSTAADATLDASSVRSRELSAPTASTTSSASGVAVAEAPPLVSKRTLRYRELFTGALPHLARLQTWTLVLGVDGRMRLEHDVGEASQNSLRVGFAKPLGPVTRLAHETHTGRWSSDGDGSVDLRFDGDAGAPLHCVAGRVSTLAGGALLVVPPHIHAPWKPARRQPVDVFKCDRAWLAAPASWQDEPQPTDLPFADLPGIEYAHDNDDMVIQQGGLRRIEAETPDAR